MKKKTEMQLKDVFTEQITGEWGNESDDSAGIKVLRTTNFSAQGRIDLNNVAIRKIGEDKVNKKVLKAGDIILEKSGGTDHTPVGRVVFCGKELNDDIYLCNNFTQALRVDIKKAVPKYIFYFMWFQHWSGATKLLQNKTTGIRNLKVKEYLQKKISLPSMPDQRKVVEILDTINLLCDWRNQQINKLELLVKSRFEELFGGFFYDKKSMEQLKDICNFIDYRGKTPEKSKEGIPLVTAKNVKNNAFTAEPREFIPETNYDLIMVRGIPKANDILFTTEAPLGNVCRMPDIYEKFCVGQRIITIQPDSERLTPEYVERALLSPQFQDDMWRHSSGSTVKGIRSKELVLLLIPVPPIERQLEFSNFVKHVDQSKAVLQYSLEKLQLLNKAVMQQFFAEEDMERIS